jgi:tRNA dimethylallyltransferase
MPSKVTFICGSTASGKSAFAATLAQKDGGIIVNCDAMQVYKDISLVTFSPTCQQKSMAPHILYNYIDLETDYSVKQYINDVNYLISQQFCYGKPVYIVGGSGFYMHSLIFGLNEVPKISLETQQLVNHDLKELGLDEIIKILKEVDCEFTYTDQYRVLRAYSVYRQTKTPISNYFKDKACLKLNLKNDYKILFLHPEREFLYNLCNQRSKKLLEPDCIAEIEQLRTRPIFSKFVSKVIGIKEISDYIQGDISYDEVLSAIQIRTRHYAKRQVTWFKRYISLPQCKLIKDVFQG